MPKPDVYRKGNLFTVYLETSVTHVTLSLRLQTTDPGILPRFERRTRDKPCACIAPSEDVIHAAVVSGLSEAEEQTQQPYWPSEIVYYADDSDRPSAFTYLAYLIALEADKAE